MNAVVNRLLATKKAPQGAFFTQKGDLHNLPITILFFRCGGYGVNTPLPPSDEGGGCPKDRRRERTTTPQSHLWRAS